MHGEHELDTAQHITNIIKSTLDYHNHFAEKFPQIKAMYGKPMFKEECQIVKLSLPRRFGHSTAALQILKEYPNCLIISHHREKTDRLEGVITIDEFRSGSQDYTLLSMMATLRDGLDFVIADDVRLTDEDQDKVFNLFDPKLLILLGGIAC